MRADVEEGANLVVGAAANDHRLTSNAYSAEIVSVRQLGFVAHRNPCLFKYFLELFLEDLRVGIDAAVHPFVRLKRRLREPLPVILRCHVSAPRRMRTGIKTTSES